MNQLACPALVRVFAVEIQARGDLARPAPGVGIGGITEMAMIDAFTDRPGFQQQSDRPAAQRSKRLAPLFDDRKFSRRCGPRHSNLGTESPSPQGEHFLIRRARTYPRQQRRAYSEVTFERSMAILDVPMVLILCHVQSLQHHD